MKKKSYKITNLDTLKAYKKANRENLIPLKSNVYNDKKKSLNKNHCRDNNFEE